MGADWKIHTADAIYARCLRDAGHLLWIADPSLPDVAARNSDTNVAEELFEQNQLSTEVGHLLWPICMWISSCTHGSASIALFP